MNNELSHLMKNIKENTGIDIEVYSETGKYFASTEKGEVTLSSKPDFEGIYFDHRQNRTFFKLQFKSARLTGSIKGTTETERNYAYMIMRLMEGADNKDAALSKSEFLKSILAGEGNITRVQKFMTRFSIPDLPLFILIIQPPMRSDEVLNFLIQYAADTHDIAVMLDDFSCVYVKFSDGENEYQSANDFASFILQSVFEEIGIKCKIGIGGTVRSMLEVYTSFQHAERALRMRGVFNSKGDIFSYKEYLLVKMLEDIPKFKLNEYLSILLESDAKAIFSDLEMINTAEEFLENNLNVSETSRNIYVHRNTLMYRLDKIERATGLNIRKFSDAVTFRLISVLYKLLN